MITYQLDHRHRPSWSESPPARALTAGTASASAGRPGALSLIAADSAFVPIHNGHAHLTAPIARVVVLGHIGPVRRRCKVAATWATDARTDRANRYQAVVGLRDCLPPLTKHPIARMQMTRSAAEEDV
jgi:hypothetical protein